MKILEARDYVNQEIWWKPKYGYVHLFEDVRQLFVDGKWSSSLLESLFTEEVCNHVQHNLMGENGLKEWDMPWWMPNSFGKFTLKSAWEIMRQVKEIQKDFKILWIKVCHLKCPFFYGDSGKREFQSEKL